jgi:Holliday junction DNA helicase RuvB
MREDEAKNEYSFARACYVEYIGQHAVKTIMQSISTGAHARRTAGPLAVLRTAGTWQNHAGGHRCNEMECPARDSGPGDTHAGGPRGAFNEPCAGGVLFIDEIHRLNATVEEVLYPAMEDFALDIIIGKGPSARSIRLDLPKFTLIGATTRMGLLTSPLRDRFGIKEQLAMYDADSLREIIVRSAHILGIEITDERRGRNRFPRAGNAARCKPALRRVRDYAEVRMEGSIDLAAAREGLDMLGVDELGLDEIDRRMWSDDYEVRRQTGRAGHHRRRDRRGRDYD